MFKSWKTRILLFLAVLGPGFITANVDNDPNGIFTYSQAGAQYGYALLWTIIPITIALIVVQEMCARMGVVTGKGLSDLIREEFGLRVTVIVMFLLVLVNFGNVIGEFAGAASSLGLFHLSKYISVPIVSGGVAAGGAGRLQECRKDLSGRFACFISPTSSRGCFHSQLAHGDGGDDQAACARVWKDSGYLYMVISVIGTTIAPWMQFYLQSSMVEKGVRVKDYAASRLDVIVGSIFTDVVAWFIIVACAATLYVHGHGISG